MLAILISSTFVRSSTGPAPGDDPQARLSVQVQGVIAEYERAKIAERYRRGKLHRARAGEVFFWKVPYGYRRVGAEPDRPARMEIFEPEADIVRAIFAAHNGAPAIAARAAPRPRYRDRPREQWIMIPVPPIIDTDTFQRSQHVSRENPKWSPRGDRARHLPLRGLIEFGHCRVGCNCHKMRGRNGTHHHYYY